MTEKEAYFKAIQHSMLFVKRMISYFRNAMCKRLNELSCVNGDSDSDSDSGILISTTAAVNVFTNEKEKRIFICQARCFTFVLRFILHCLVLSAFNLDTIQHVQSGERVFSIIRAFPWKVTTFGILHLLINHQKDKMLSS